MVNKRRNQTRETKSQKRTKGRWKDQRQRRRRRFASAMKKKKKNCENEEDL